ncbi:hypothetical protein [Jiangella sp. DSM 45060]|uniref:hypothetical protein n=1 Tax=Jiangella sp. DSM 45060 TaxID=1798224 RepID=UPI00087A88AC|nr:hypothetical protein [Jiangella sp. DSM 45060]SDT19652.1 hypothetical protein SAMN04515669_3069 [Jiangella sp. DSM 45060]
MCHPALCKTCGRTTWRGCGLHVQQVMAGIPEEERCPGHGSERGSLLGRIFGRRS